MLNNDVSVDKLEHLESFLQNQESIRMINEAARIENEKNRIKGINVDIDAKISELSVKFAEPIDYMSGMSYSVNTIVNFDNASFISKKEVPVGVSPESSSYWHQLSSESGLIEAERKARHTEIEDLQNQIDEIRAAITDLADRL